MNPQKGDIMEKICVRTLTRCKDNFENNIDCPSNGPIGCEYCKTAHYQIRFTVCDVGGSICNGGIGKNFNEARMIAEDILDNSDPIHGPSIEGAPWAIEVSPDGKEIKGPDGFLIIRELFGKICCEECENFFTGEHTGAPLCRIEKNNVGRLNSAPLREVCPSVKVP